MRVRIVRGAPAPADEERGDEGRSADGEDRLARAADPERPSPGKRGEHQPCSDRAYPRLRGGPAPAVAPSAPKGV